MQIVKNILLIILGIVITIAFFWLIFFVALPVLIVIGLIALLFFIIKGIIIFKRPAKKNSSKDNIQEAEIIEEK